MFDIKVRLEGWEEIERKLKELENKLANQVTKKGLKECAKVIRKATLPLVPVYQGQYMGKRAGKVPGDTKRGLKVAMAKSKKGRIGFNVQIGKGAYKGDTFYASFVIWDHFHGKRGRPRKLIPGNNFMERGFDRSWRDGVKAAQDVMAKEIAKIMST